LISHISHKTSEMWGTLGPLSGQKGLEQICWWTTGLFPGSGRLGGFRLLVCRGPQSATADIQLHHRQTKLTSWADQASSKRRAPVARQEPLKVDALLALSVTCEKALVSMTIRFRLTTATANLRFGLNRLNECADRYPVEGRSPCLSQSRAYFQSHRRLCRRRSQR
jgi:hypothetical protein